MGKKSLNLNDNIYCSKRQNADMTRAQASEATYLSESRLEKIENGKIQPTPEDVSAMAKAYNDPALCNYYCANECCIGQDYVPEVKEKPLAQIAIEVLASLNSLNKDKERLIEIVADGKIDNDELYDFAAIQDQLEQLAMTVAALQLWINQTIADGKIDKEKLDAIHAEMDASK
jgi:transcriptional regulator with XRE-family HTH domain